MEETDQIETKGKDTKIAAPTKKDKKARPENLTIPPKKPKLTKAERRVLQEQQRAAKAAKQEQGGEGKGRHIKSQDASNGTKRGAVSPEKPLAQHLSPQEKQDEKTVDLFSHLPQFRDLPDSHSTEFTSTLHPVVIELGLKYATGTIRGGNSRCRAMIDCFLQVFREYLPPPSVDFRTHIDQAVLKPSFTFWTTQCRPHSVSMGNAFTFCKTAVASLERDLEWGDARIAILDTLERFVQERLDYADQAIAQHALAKIEDGDVILTFGNAEVVGVLLETASKQEHVDFYVWVVDARPLLEGRCMLKRLREAGIPCGYIQLNALTYVMQQVTKVFLGASALMSNGSIYGRVGTASVALLANDHHIPVLVCCETYKISNKVQLESITNNELGDPEALVAVTSTPAHVTNNNHMDGSFLQIAPSPIARWKETANLKVLHLVYDVTPPDFVTGIVTEVGIIPPTSVAVLLREMNPQDATY